MKFKFGDKVLCNEKTHKGKLFIVQRINEEESNAFLAGERENVVCDLSKIEPFYGNSLTEFGENFYKITQEMDGMYEVHPLWNKADEARFRYLQKQLSHLCVLIADYIPQYYRNENWDL